MYNGNYKKQNTCHLDVLRKHYMFKVEEYDKDRTILSCHLS
jgi:hypothetical protein